MYNLVVSPLIDESRIAERIQEMGASLTKRFSGEQLVAICVLRGSFIFYADLIREIETDIICDFIGVSSYDHSKSTGEIKLNHDLSKPVEGKNVLLVEDIVDTGLTMNYLRKLLNQRKVKSLTTAALLLKPEALKEKCPIDLVGFEIKNDFVVGYGLDYQGYYRNLPYVGIVENMN